MAVPSTSTFLRDLFNPQVVSDIINEKLLDNMVFTPLATVDNTLQGRPGNTVTMPYFNYIGDAADLAEGADVDLEKLTHSEKQVVIKKIAKGIEITDEAVLSGYGDPMGEIASQIAKAMGSKMDWDLLDALNGNTDNVVTLTAAMTPDDIADALIKFGEDIDGRKVLLTDPAGYATLRKANGWIPNTEIGAQTIIRGSVGFVHGTEVVVGNRLITPDNQPTNYHIVKPGALALFMKRDTQVEYDRDIVSFSNVITASKHYASYLLDPNKAIKIVQPASGGGGGGGA